MLDKIEIDDVIIVYCGNYVIVLSMMHGIYLFVKSNCYMEFMYETPDRMTYCTVHPYILTKRFLFPQCEPLTQTHSFILDQHKGLTDIRKYPQDDTESSDKTPEILRCASRKP
jgi:hypothetical protein